MFLASFATSISYPCPPLPDDPGSRCVSFERAILHPTDLASNMQESMTRFIVNFLVGFIIVFVLLITVDTARAARREGAEPSDHRDQTSRNP
jgi:hypothetical protein